jgi:hypothetical protein
LNNPVFQKQLNRYFWLIVTLQLCLWSILPLFIRHSLGNDLIEALAWGRQFAWGYDKNPFLPGFLAHLGGLFGLNGFVIYLIQQLFIVLGIWSVKELTFELTNNSGYALVASAALLLCSSYNLDVQIYNDNYILQGLLPFSALFFYRGIKKNNLKQWLLSAGSLGLATLAKYSAVLFLPVYALYLLLAPKARGYYFSSKPYLALLLYGILLLPNIIWLYHQNFNALQYAFIARGLLHQLEYSRYLNNNLDFLLNLLLEILPTLLALFIAIEYKKNVPNSSFPQTPNKEFSATLYSCLLGFGPLILLYIAASLLGFFLYREWGSSLLSFLGTALLSIFHPRISQRSVMRFVVFNATIMVSFGIGYVIVSEKNDAGAYPGPEIAKSATQLWHRYYASPLLYVGGDRYTAGYIGYYSKDKPQIWLEWNSNNSPWINKKTILCKGALFAIGSGHTVQHFFKGTQFPAFIHQQFPNLIIFPLQSFSWYRNHTHQPPIKIRFALLPPDKSYCSA